MSGNASDWKIWAGMNFADAFVLSVCDKDESNNNDKWINMYICTWD